MMELRKHYFLDQWSLIAELRSQRPHQLMQAGQQKKTDWFAPGKEKLTPPETGRREENGKWYMRWFPNRFPAVTQEGDQQIRTADTYYTYSHPYGFHEILVETPETRKQLWDLPAARIKEVLDVYMERIAALAGKPHVRYVTVFKNHGEAAGASIEHSHTQIIANNFTPPLVQAKAMASVMDSRCAYCDILARERRGVRKCYDDEQTVAFTPYAPRLNYEAWLMPAQHLHSLAEMSDEQRHSLATALHFLLQRLKKLKAPYNFALTYAPDKTDLHFHIELMPRLNTWAGFELATGAYIVTVSPETAAAFYREGK